LHSSIADIAKFEAFKSAIQTIPVMKIGEKIDMVSIYLKREQTGETKIIFVFALRRKKSF
jgi:hypothetical protein